jgi:hypothetical protein
LLDLSAMLQLFPSAYCLEWKTSHLNSKSTELFVKINIPNSGRNYTGEMSTRLVRFR